MNTKFFAQVVDRHYESLYKFAFSLARTEADACDLTQQTFYLWVLKGHQLRDQSKAKAWLFTSLHRVFLGSCQGHGRLSHHSLEEIPTENSPAFSPDVVNAADSSQVLSALAKVDPAYQATVALFYLEDLSYQEIAGILEVPLGTVKSRIARGILQLRRLLGVSTSERSEVTLLEKEAC